MFPHGRAENPDSERIIIEYSGAKRLGHGEGYQYAHDFPGHHVKQDYLPAPPLMGMEETRQAGLPKKKRYYEPTDQGFEQEIKKRLSRWNK